MCMCYRIIFVQVNVCMQDFFEFNCTSRIRGHPYKLYTWHSCSNVWHSYFTNCVINVWNTLPAGRIDFSSFAVLKRTVQQIDLSTFVLCYYVYVFLGYYQCHSWPCNPLHTCFHVYVITLYLYVFMCENKDDDDYDDDWYHDMSVECWHLLPNFSVVGLMVCMQQTH